MTQSANTPPTVTHYFLRTGHALSMTNKLEKDISSYLQSLNGRLIDFKDLEAMENEIKLCIEGLNAKHPRCKPFKISFWHSRGSIYFSGFSKRPLDVLPASLSHISFFTSRP